MEVIHAKRNLEFSTSKEIHSFRTSLKQLSTRPYRQPMKRNLESHGEYVNLVTKKASGRLLTFPGKVLQFSYSRKYYIGKSESAAKHSAAWPNQQINGKEGKGENRNDSGIAFKRGYLYIKTKRVIHRPVCCTNTRESTAKSKEESVTSRNNCHVRKRQKMDKIWEYTEKYYLFILLLLFQIFKHYPMCLSLHSQELLKFSHLHVILTNRKIMFVFSEIIIGYQIPQNMPRNPYCLKTY